MTNFKIKTVDRTAAIIAITPAILAAITAVLLNGAWWKCAAAAVCIYLATYFLSGFFIRQYVIYRIKPLYQLLFSKDIHTSRLSEELRKVVQDDVVNDIQRNIDQLVALSDSEVERLRQKDAEMTGFLVAVSHEIRTPVFNIQAYAETLLANWKDDPQVIPQFAEKIVSNAERLALMIEDIDKLSYYESGGSVVYKDYFDVRSLISEVADAQVLYLQKKDITVELNTDSFDRKKPIPVYAERFRIFSILENLIQNAIMHSHEKSKITIGLIDMFDKVLVEVTDRGDGIPPKDLVHIFDKLYRTDKSRSRQTGGFGMGLALVKGVIDDHGETITARSEPGVGTTISFSITKRPAKTSGKEADSKIL